jgi:hypothetical protein
MTKAQLLKDVDIKEGDKFYVVRAREEDGLIKWQRVCAGFNGLELLGILEKIQTEILKQFSGEIKADIVERKVLK